MLQVTPDSLIVEYVLSLFSYSYLLSSPFWYLLSLVLDIYNVNLLPLHLSVALEQFTCVWYCPKQAKGIH